MFCIRWPGNARSLDPDQISVPHLLITSHGANTTGTFTTEKYITPQTSLQSTLFSGGVTCIVHLSSLLVV